MARTEPLAYEYVSVCFAEAGQIVAVARMPRTENVSCMPTSSCKRVRTDFMGTGNMVATAIVDQ
jgi:hypothetical protein